MTTCITPERGFDQTFIEHSANKRTASKSESRDRGCLHPLNRVFVHNFLPGDDKRRGSEEWVHVALNLDDFWWVDVCIIRITPINKQPMVLSSEVTNVYEHPVFTCGSFFHNSQLAERAHHRGEICTGHGGQRTGNIFRKFRERIPRPRRLGWWLNPTRPRRFPRVMMLDEISACMNP